ncbi:glycoside hydrolase family 76 protein [Pleomassaria siparia CBS 279.74]|uniref:Glycoside hydrolase family 76 protein n=1 Tax=Pleomassaria siparia CBS 279.74 TaxID=1314801 RepID=A0A6G1KBE7_9PLEO|nr:glycoside hydrolase family 76 protein [Pleomassaria siparia CBS 279.74]
MKFSLLSILALLLPLTAAQTQNATASVTDPTDRAELALTALQTFYNESTGLWLGWWQSANAMTVVANLAKVDSNPKIQSLAAQVFANTVAKAPAHNIDPNAEPPLKKKRKRAMSGYDKGYDENGIPFTTLPKGWGEIPSAHIRGRANAPAFDPYSWLDGFYDDDLWWALGYIAAYDVTKKAEYLTLSEGIFNAVARVWPSSCGNGGIFWNSKKNVVNAIANELFFSTAAHLANRASDANTYANWAVKSIDWFVATGMINNASLINDGLTSAPDCKNNGLPTWSYNQGVILGGLAELYKARPNSTYMNLANRLAKASIEGIANKAGVIQDPCGPLCGADASQFKGIYMRGLQAVYAMNPDPSYAASIKTNADSVWANDRNAKNQLSIQWAGPFIGTANSTTQSSAMEALIAAIVVK